MYRESSRATPETEPPEKYIKHEKTKAVTRRSKSSQSSGKYEVL
jgi:hypothetical protein